jgi:transposase
VRHRPNVKRGRAGGARHDTLEELGSEVLVADAQKVKGLAPLACKTDKIDARVFDRRVQAPGGRRLAA